MKLIDVGVYPITCNPENNLRSADSIIIIIIHWNAQVDESLRKMYHYQQNVPQHYYPLDTLE